MIKVCHMSSAHGSEDERIFFKECVSLAKEGYEVYQVVRGNSYEKSGVQIIGVGLKDASRMKRMTEAAKRVYQEALALDAEIYHFHDPELLPYGLKLKRKGKIVIFDSHENTLDQIYEKEWIPKPIRSLLYLFFGIYQKYVCKRLDAVISVSPHICEYFLKYQPKTIKITNYPILTSEYEKPNIDSKRIVFAGGISNMWNHDTIILALETFPDVKYVLCGDGDGAYFETLKSLPGWNQVDFLGRVPHLEIPNIMSKCGIGVSVLDYNRNAGGKRGTQGNTKIYEQMMAGLPIICTNFDLWREFIERYQCGICVEPKDIEGMRRAIDQIISNPIKAKEMGENGRLAIEREFNWNFEEKKLFALYKELLGE